MWRWPWWCGRDDHNCSGWLQRASEQQRYGSDNLLAMIGWCGDATRTVECSEAEDESDAQHEQSPVPCTHANWTPSAPAALARRPRPRPPSSLSAPRVSVIKLCPRVYSITRVLGRTRRVMRAARTSATSSNRTGRCSPRPSLLSCAIATQSTSRSGFDHCILACPPWGAMTLRLRSAYLTSGTSAWQSLPHIVP